MNGPQHFVKAEEYLTAAVAAGQQPGQGPSAVALTALAQVHATLALAAATVLPTVRAERYVDDAWAEVLG